MVLIGLIGAVVAVVLVLAVVVDIVIGNNSEPGGSASGSAVPAGVVGGTGGGILVDPAAANTKVPTLEVYVDFQCPNCGQMEKEFGPHPRHDGQGRADQVCRAHVPGCQARQRLLYAVG